MNRLLYILLFIFAGVITSCEDFLEPEKDNRLSEEQLLQDPAFAEGLLLKAYDVLPENYDFNIDVISDDAVTNDLNSLYLKMATGEWKAMNNPISQWNNAYQQIFYINSFIGHKDKINWSTENERLGRLHWERLTGEAYGLRGWYQFLLLKFHAGKATNGQILGFPIMNKTATSAEAGNLPRNTYEECLAQIMADCDTAIKYLPETYADITGDAVYNLAKGARWTNRLTASAVKAFKSRVLIHAASPAFNPSGDAVKWDAAAKAAGVFLAQNGGLNALSETGLSFYLYNNGNDKDVIWARAISSTSNLEKENFPPSLIGEGRTNPTQNLVDAFPMKNGYPISAGASNFDPQKPYENRDPRLGKYIIFNGAVFGAKGTIYTHVGAPKNGINVQTNSTRTGYYLRKFMLENVQIENPNVPQNHFYTYLRFTEVFLNYAEAANEAWGPDVDGAGIGFTARQVIQALRKRAGIEQPDNYLASLTSKQQFRSLVQTERRLELCFEGHRFWDLRRWNLKEEMKKPVNAVFINGESFDYQQVETRQYADYMIYGPIPYTEILKAGDLLQNEGW